MIKLLGQQDFSKNDMLQHDVFQGKHVIVVDRYKMVWRPRQRLLSRFS